MSAPQRKPKLLLFQYKYDHSLPEFLLTHKKEHVKCLAKHFDVTVISEDADYQQACETFQPEIAVFESGVSHATCQRLRITNAHACPEIPKVGLHNGDGFCPARAGFISDMDHWGIETFFTISTTTAEHTPDIAGATFVWPNSVDADVFRDYGAWKSIPVLFTGNTNSLYPWRQKIVKLVADHFPSMLCPHPGYDPGATSREVLHGEVYARTINASFVVPACGTVAREVVRKHFEIPASRACLLAERSEALEMAGFVDMENCVFADERDVLDKLRFLFRNPDRLQQITDAGYHLVHSRHTMEQRNELLQWLNLQRQLEPGQKIIQTAPFQPLRIAASNVARNTHAMSHGLHLDLIHEGDELLRVGDYAAAERVFMRCMNYMRWMPELKLKVAIAKLYQGDAGAARNWLSQQLEFILFQYKAADPDPVEWAYFIISLLCLGDLKEASVRAKQFPKLRHPELDRARWVVEVLNSVKPGAASLASNGVTFRRTVHQVPQRRFPIWVREICVMLRRSGQSDLAQRLENQSEPEPSPPLEVRSDNRAEPTRDSDPPEPVRSLRTFRTKFLGSRSASTLKKLIAKTLHTVEAKYGYFLPYRVSAMRDDELFRDIQTRMRDDRLKTVLLIGARTGAGCTEATFAGARENPSRPVVHCTNTATRRFRALQRESAGNLRCHTICTSSPRDLTKAVDDVVDGLRSSSENQTFDAVVIDGEGLSEDFVLGPCLAGQLQDASCVVINDITSANRYAAKERLLRDSDASDVTCNPSLRDGYVVVVRRMSHNNEKSPGLARAADQRVDLRTLPDMPWADVRG